jgi:hypothetical protein
MEPETRPGLLAAVVLETVAELESQALLRNRRIIVDVPVRRYRPWSHHQSMGGTSPGGRFSGRQRVGRGLDLPHPAWIIVSDRPGACLAAVGNSRRPAIAPHVPAICRFAAGGGAQRVAGIPRQRGGEGTLPSRRSPDRKAAVQHGHSTNPQRVE